jgi:hypothetical protein
VIAASESLPARATAQRSEEQCSIGCSACVHPHPQAMLYSLQHSNTFPRVSPQRIIEPIEYAEITQSSSFRLAMKVCSVAFRKMH